MRRLLIVGIASLFMGCALESSAVSPEDGGATDAGGDTLAVVRPDGDAAPGPADSGRSDASAMDATAVDATAVDAADPSDASAGSDTGTTADDAATDTAMPPSCDSLFSGFVPGYVFCDEREDACEFYTYTDRGPNCRELCDMAGLTCVTSWSEGSSECERSSDYGCEHRHTDGICICAR